VQLRTIPLPYTTVASETTANTFIPATGWISTNRVAKLRPTWELIQATGSIRVAPAYQTADVENAPGTATAIGSQVSSTGLKYAVTWTSVLTELETKQLVRFGWLTSLVTGTTLANAYVGGRLEVLQD
jgi:hypothetical protein